MLKKIILTFLFVIFSSGAFAFELPDKIKDWHLVSEFVTPLIAGEKDFGRVVYKNYERESPKGFLQIIMTDGTGTGNLYVPSDTNNSKGVIPFNSDYKVLEISGKKAILETQENLPLSLALNYSDNIIITIESYSFNENEIIRFMEELLTKI
ncbi:MAG: hypothetical protein IJQ99_09850 [Synergistaceae bacterium]|nr:hypothetical protein [Synergistaceae bacterium]MBR0317157.1 hypothetical protein [Synergistaceae bacterium]